MLLLMLMLEGRVNLLLPAAQTIEEADQGSSRFSETLRVDSKHISVSALCSSASALPNSGVSLFFAEIQVGLRSSHSGGRAVSKSQSMILSNGSI